MIVDVTEQSEGAPDPALENADVWIRQTADLWVQTIEQIHKQFVEYRKERDRAQAELAILHHNFLVEQEARLAVMEQRDEARAEVARLKRASIRPEPSRLEIAAMIYAARTTNAELVNITQCFKAAAALITVEKEVAE